MRFRLRTLLIVLALGPPVIAGAWFVGALAFRTPVKHPTYNDREAMRVLEREYQAGHLEIVSQP